MAESIKQRLQALNNNVIGRELKKLWDSARTELAALRTLSTELRTDHGTFKTAADQTETLIEELHDDAATQKTLNDELIADHATFKAVCDDLKTLANDIRAKLQGDYIITTPALAIGTTTTNVSNVAFNYLINGVPYAKDAVAAGTAPGNDVIPIGTFGAVAFDIGADGTIDAIEATDNATGYASAVLAAAGLPAVAADHARMGYVTASKSDGAFTFGTTALDALNTTVAYTNGTSAFAAIGAAVATSAPATLTATAPATLTAPKPASAPATITAAAVTESLGE